MILFLIAGLAIMLVTLAIIFDNILQKLKLLDAAMKSLDADIKAIKERIG
jgi:outer membrane lipoprotein-sorting protein